MDSGTGAPTGIIPVGPAANVVPVAPPSMDPATLLQLLAQQMQAMQQLLALQQQQQQKQMVVTPANMAAVRIPQKMVGSIKKFTGKQDVEAWLSQFENVKRVNAWDDGMAVQHFSLLLSNEVFNWYKPLGEEVKKSFLALSAAF